MLASLVHDRKLFQKTVSRKRQQASVGQVTGLVSARWDWLVSSKTAERPCTVLPTFAGQANAT